VIEETRSEGRTVYVAAGNLKNITAKSLREFKRKEGKWATFDEFRKFNCTTWEICIDESTCSCPYFQKNRAVQTSRWYDGEIKKNRRS